MICSTMSCWCNFNLHTCKCVLCLPAQFGLMQCLAESSAATLKGGGNVLQQDLEKTKQTKNNNCSENVWSKVHALSFWYYICDFVFTSKIRHSFVW